MRVRSILAAAALAAAGACAVNPATGERELSLVSESREIQMGREGAQEVSASLGIVDDPGLEAYVSGIGKRLAGVSERPELPWSFEVVDDPVVNAFALPGGFIYVTRGILAHFESEAELAGVMGHEVGHVTAKHSVSQISRQQLQQLGLGVGMIFSENVRNVGGLLSAGLQLLNLRYSRADESQADELGLRYISRLDYDPTAMIGVFRMLETVSGAPGDRAPEWQSTHPYPENREAHIREQIQSLNLPSGGRVGADAFLDHLDGLVYGDNPRAGYFKGARFVHPDLAFEVTFPEGWSTVNQRTVVGAVSPSQDAVVAVQVADSATDPRAALTAFLAGDGISGGPIREETTGGVRRATAPFQARTDNGSLEGEVAFVLHDGTVFQVLGYADPARWTSYSGVVGRAISSFAELTDAAILAVRPWTLEVRTLPSATSLRTYATGESSPVSVEELAALNRVDPGEVLSSGKRIKWVVGTPLP